MATILRANHTNGSANGYSERLNGTANEKFGIARSLSVMPGDVVKMEVYAKYVDNNTADWNTALVNLMSAIANNTGGIAVDGGSYSSSTSSFGFVQHHNTSGSSGNGPKAYLNWMVFDRDYNFKNGGFVGMSDAAKETGQDVAHERLAPADLFITEPGYVYIYLSNDETQTPVEVFFDDFKVEHVKSPVVQMDDYYPFGGEFNSYSRESSVPNQYKFNGGSELQDELGLQIYLTDYRVYDPWGRLGWWQIDPRVDEMYSWSPYNYSFNNPIRYNDPNGDCPICPAIPVIIEGASLLEGLIVAATGATIGMTLKAYGKEILEHCFPLSNY